MMYPGQCNNVFIFPGLGFGAVSVKATAVADEFLLAAARAVAEEVPQEMLEAGRIYPELKVCGTRGTNCLACVLCPFVLMLAGSSSSF